MSSSRRIEPEVRIILGSSKSHWKWFKFADRKLFQWWTKFLLPHLHFQKHTFEAESFGKPKDIVTKNQKEFRCLLIRCIASVSQSDDDSDWHYVNQRSYILLMKNEQRDTFFPVIFEKIVAKPVLQSLLVSSVWSFINLKKTRFNKTLYKMIPNNSFLRNGRPLINVEIYTLWKTLDGVQFLSTKCKISIIKRPGTDNVVAISKAQNCKRKNLCVFWNFCRLQIIKKLKRGTWETLNTSKHVSKWDFRLVSQGWKTYPRRIFGNFDIHCAT